MNQKSKKPEEEIFYRILETPPEQRGACLKETCGDDQKLYERVEALLQANDLKDGFLQSPVLDCPPTLEICPNMESPGATIGRYKILEKIGEGGMAVVYMAEQQEPIRRKVALKIIKLGMDTKSVIARFEAERQALALMDHPNIARVLDAGATDTGRPYFVMELVKGASVTDFCDVNNLSTRERLELFVQICRAVQHAHQKGIIHRDIKPTNVMVTMHDGEPVPKVIDFGIAKAVDRRLTEKTFFTGYAQIIGTPAYMSPEQAELNGLDIDIRTDVYSLGTLLYELLTGSPPFETEYLLSEGYKEMQRIIREQEPTRPSTKISTLGQARIDVAKYRKTTPEVLEKLIRADLDWVVMKSLEKDRDRRYDTVNECAADIKRYLNNEPVSAGPPSTLYRVKKFIQRRRGLVTAIAAVVAAFMIGFVVATVMYFQAEHSRAEAQRQAQISKAVIEFINNDLFSSIDPAQAKGREITVREILDIASEKINDQFKDDPLVEASIRMTLGQTYRSLQQYEKAEPHLRKVVEIFEDSLDPIDPNIAISLNNLAQLQQDTNRLPEAESLLERAVIIMEKSYGPDHPNVATALNNLGTLLHDLARFSDAETMFRRALEIDEASLGPNDPKVATDLNNLAELLRVRNRLDEAEPLFRRALAIDQDHFGEIHANVSRDLNNLAVLLMAKKRLSEAEPLLRRALTIEEQAFGKDHPNVAIRKENLAELLKTTNRMSEAETMMRGALAINERAFGNGHQSVALNLKDLADILMRTKRFNEAEPMIRRALSIDEQANGTDHLSVGQDLSMLVAALLATNRFTEAYPLLQRELEIYDKNFGANHPHTQRIRDTYESVQKKMEEN